MLAFTHEQPAGRILFGAGRRHDGPSEVARFEPTAALIIGGSHDVATVEELRDGIDVPVESIVGVQPHVPAAAVADALTVVDRVSPDVVVTIGGGSATGLGKKIALERDVTLISIPTTYAGSEMTPIWGTTDGGVKTTGRSPRVLPATVIYDPELTTGLPKSVTVNSACNAIAHCVEALWLPETSPISVEAAVGAVTSIIDGVTEVVEDLGNVAARARLLYGAHRAGAVLAVAGTGLLHQTAHVLGGMFNLDHGALYSVLMPPMVDHHASVVPAAEVHLRAALGPDPVGALVGLTGRLGAPRSLSELGLPPSGLADATVAVSRHSGVPADVIEPLLIAAGATQ